MCEKKKVFCGALIGCCLLFGVLATADRPPAPASVDVHFVEWNEIDVAWTPVSASPAVTKYRIYIDNFSACGCSRVEETPPSKTTFVDMCVQLGLPHHYAVSAVNAEGEGPKAFGEESVPWRQPWNCATISSLTWNDSAGRVEITWKGEATAQSYKVWRSTSPSGTASLVGAEVLVPGGYEHTCLGNHYTRYDDTVEGGTTYYYQVQAINQGGSTSLGSSCTASIAIPGVPTNLPPTASFTVTPAAPQPGETVTFDAGGSSDPDGPITNYQWQFGDGATTSGADKDVVTHSYSTTATYAVVLVVTDNHGATDDCSHNVTVATPGNDSPVADFSVTPSDPKMGEQVQFDAGASYDPDGTIVEYQWSFGDGATATGLVVQHTYSAPADYGAHLAVKDNHGATGEHAQVIHVAVVHALAPSITLKCGKVTCDASGGTVDIKWSATDDTTAAKDIQYQYCLDEEPWPGKWSKGTEPSPPISGLENGYHTFHLQAKDAEGNVAEAECNFPVLCTQVATITLEEPPKMKSQESPAVEQPQAVATVASGTAEGTSECFELPSGVWLVLDSYGITSFGPPYSEYSSSESSITLPFLGNVSHGAGAAGDLNCAAESSVVSSFTSCKAWQYLGVEVKKRGHIKVVGRLVGVSGERNLGLAFGSLETWWVVERLEIVTQLVVQQSHFVEVETLKRIPIPTEPEGPLSLNPPDWSNALTSLPIAAANAYLDMGAMGTAFSTFMSFIKMDTAARKQDSRYKEMEEAGVLETYTPTFEFNVGAGCYSIQIGVKAQSQTLFAGANGVFFFGNLDSINITYTELK